ncbi:MAG: hypothetical protein CM15mP89_5230 [Gammaproteobacteria bacterium]|nr:MAG: hypothetical protein CM15mP89_5230 [Gammaproteobacteria bacterium]
MSMTLPAIPSCWFARIRELKGSTIPACIGPRAQVGKAQPELRCPYHGFCWHLDGSFKEAYCDWEFDQAQLAN